ncbi:MAG: hypothetical protein LBE31_05930 [Deltaproteobacteria bacterium]|jgi:hypothetical protein|nr:hypothetical protein [Deltaproteobacteria bacterium]
MAVDNVSFTPSVTAAELTESQYSDKIKNVTYQMYMAFFEKELGQEFKAKMDNALERFSVCQAYRKNCRMIADQIALPRDVAKVKTAENNKFAEELSKYFPENGLTFSGGSAPTRRDWDSNYKELDGLLNSLYAELNQIKRDALVFIAEYESYINAASSSIEGA